MKRKEFESLDNISLVWACIEPVIQPIRGKDFKVKTTVYEKLTPPQRSLMMFQVLYGHSRGGITQFYSHNARLLSKPGVWGQFKVSLNYFGDNIMSGIFEEMEGVYHKIEAASHHNGDWPEVSIYDMEKDRELSAAIYQLDARFHGAVPETIRRIGQYIRNHPEEFVRIDD